MGLGGVVLGQRTDEVRVVEAKGWRARAVKRSQPLSESLVEVSARCPSLDVLERKEGLVPIGCGANRDDVWNAYDAGLREPTKPPRFGLKHRGGGVAAGLDEDFFSVRERDVVRVADIPSREPPHGLDAPAELLSRFHGSISFATGCGIAEIRVGARGHGRTRRGYRQQRSGQRGEISHSIEPRSAQVDGHPSASTGLQQPAVEQATSRLHTNGSRQFLAHT